MRSVLFRIFGMPIHSYGLMIVVGFMLGVWRARNRAKAVKINPDHIMDFCIILLICGILGSRIVYVLLNISTESLTDIYKVWEGGLSFHGGVAFALLGGYLYARRLKLDFMSVCDLLAPSLAIGYAFARIGCFLNGCCYGCPTSLPWGVRFMENGTLTPPSHPTQLYAFAASLGIFALLRLVEKASWPKGGVFWSYIGLYGIYRYLIEFLRSGYSAQLAFGGMTQAQWVSILMIVLAVTMLRRKVWTAK